MSHFSKYRKGQKVIFTAQPFYDRNAQNDSGKIATIVRYDGKYYDIFIESSANNKYTNGKISWHVPEKDLSLVGQMQLLFEFMYDA